MMLTAWEKKHGIETTHSNTPNFDEVNRKLAAHEIDCFVSLEQPFWKERGISRIDMIGKSDIYFVIINL